MANVKERMIDILDSVPEEFFDGLKPTEMVFKLMFEYIDIMKMKQLLFQVQTSI
ncbi:MAG: hypothetical protein IJ809_04540 [Clostridia bacterium]|nr:hypothetical protein [Clostridia bacterium]